MLCLRWILYLFHQEDIIQYKEYQFLRCTFVLKQKYQKFKAFEKIGWKYLPLR